jgi:uncharacterized membrane protein YvbJ
MKMKYFKKYWWILLLIVLFFYFKKKQNNPKNIVDIKEIERWTERLTSA